MAKFKSYEEVIVKSEKDDLKEINGSLGIIFSDPDNSILTVFIKDLEECWMVDAAELNSTGRIFKHEDFYDGSSISVKVDSNGKGHFV